jgi:prepilin-type N-terminal cleavage/methylation domain-containing protein
MMSFRSAVSRRAGFTLPEVIIATTVVALTIGMFVRTFVVAERSTAIANERIKAVHLSRLNMETLLTNTYYSSALRVTNVVAWVTNVSIDGASTTRYVCGYSVRTSLYPTARIVALTNRWYSELSTRTNTVSVATAVSSGFQW